MSTKARSPYEFREGVVNPGGGFRNDAKGGLCVVADCPNDSLKGGFYCGDHKAQNDERRSAAKTVRTRNAPRKKAEQVETIVGEPTSAARTAPRPGKSKAEKELAVWLSMAFVVLTYAIARYAAGGRGLMLSGADADLTRNLTMTDDEADSISAVLAKKIAPTSFYGGVGHKVVETLDVELVGALTAMWEYGQRVAPYIVGPRLARREARKIVQQDVAQPQGESRVRPQQAPSGPASQGNGVVPLHRIDP